MTTPLINQPNDAKPTPEDKKLNQFRDELQKLLEKYQYKMELSLNYARGGIVPVMQMVNAPPAKKEKK